MNRPRSVLWLSFALSLAALGLPGCEKSPGNPCVPTTCEAEGRTCGALADGCGETLQCGTCDGPYDRCDEDVGVCACDYDACDGACCGPAERCAATECVERGWVGVGITDVRAPDEYRVIVTLDRDTGPTAPAVVASFSLASGAGDLAVLGASYDAGQRQVTLETDRQKLGVTYTLTIETGPEAGADLDATFLAADTARFWVTDFADPDFGDYEITANRVGVGDHAVAYVEQGFDATDTPEAIAAFDAQIFPPLTQSRISAPDVDGNGRIVLLGLDGQGYYGGYFSPVNQYPDAQTMAWWGRHSNEMEIVHVNILQSTWYAREVVTHEFGHLLYHARHGFQQTYWDYHDEGLAEAGVHHVWGSNDYAVAYYLADPAALIRNGLSLVHWTWGEYANYAQAYLFWIYLASRAGGLSALGELFDLESGAPSEVDAWIGAALGSDLPTVQSDGLVAAWVQDATGIHGFEGLVDLGGARPQTVASGTSSLDLPPFGGAFFRLSDGSVDYPGTQGADIRYVGISGAGAVDRTAPFDLAGGALLVFNASQDAASASPEPSGPDLPAVHPGPPSPAPLSRAWWSPPPLNPERLHVLEAWRARTLLRLAEEGWPAPRR